MAGQRQIVAHELEDIGVDHSQYFQGRGVALSDWTAVFVGVGDNPREATADARENCATSGWDTTTLDLEEMPTSPSAHADCGGDDDPEDTSHDECELYYYVALYVRGTEEE